ncbi:hypothetical protein MACJ_001309 [Theileria orientalis]|uniref:Oxysterol-binding protein n=1 Tax=Theileria orientalis TaxID=68886 RepID=A0A976M8C8_THEOR|nr:hypothetical protein MACJ_001309 [Theileria orientalis]
MLEPDCLSYSVEKDGVIKESFLLSHCKIRLCPDDPVRLDIEVVGSCLLCLRTDTPLEKHKWYVSFKRAQKLAFQPNKKRPESDSLKSAQQLSSGLKENERQVNSSFEGLDSNRSSVTSKSSEPVDASKRNQSETTSKSISNIFVKSKTGREQKSSISYILDNTETFEHISTKILNELESTTNSESLKHLNTFRLIVTDFCCSIKQLSKEEFRPGEVPREHYYPKSLEPKKQESSDKLRQPVSNLYSENSVISEKKLYSDRFYECEDSQKESFKTVQGSSEQLSEQFEDSDSSEDLMNESKESKMLDYHDFTLDSGLKDPDRLSESEESMQERYTVESDLFKDRKHEETYEEKGYTEGEGDVLHSEQVESRDDQSAPLKEPVQTPSADVSLETQVSKIKLHEETPQIDRSKIQRRTRLPHARLEHKVSVWSILKDFIGKDLSRIRMPIVFNEPTSNLQRAAEDFTYYKYLNEAVEMEKSIDRLANVTIFSITPYCSAVGRSYKPFNPLLGETFEITHGGFSFFAEQVAHHPPILAFHCFNDKFESSGSLNMVINFTGKAIEANLMGPFLVDLKLPSGLEKFSIQRCNMILHNLIFGKMWIEAVGSVIIKNITEGEFSVMQYLKKGWFNKEIHKVRGLVFDKFGTQHYYISGIWSERIYIEKVYPQTAKSSQKLLNDDGSLHFSKYRFKNEADAWDAFVNDIDWENISLVPNTRREAWRPDERPPNNQDYYGFGYLTMQLNELTEDYDRTKGAQMPKTDSRYRPDQRMYENGRVDEANEEKKRLEDKQRAVAKHRADNNLTYKPHWFTKVIDPATHQANWIYKGTYWEKKRDGTVDEGTPDIFG